VSTDVFPFRPIANIGLKASTEAFRRSPPSRTIFQRPSIADISLKVSTDDFQRSPIANTSLKVLI
jgi:hypothetical protein